MNIISKKFFPMVKKIVGRHTHILSLVALSFFIHIQWMLGHNFFYSDLLYYYNNLLSNGHFTQTRISWGGEGTINDQLWRLPYYLLDSFIGDSVLSTKILLFIPFVLIFPISIYFFLASFFSSKRVCFFGSLFFMSNTYFLAINSQGHLHLSIATCIFLIGWSLYQRFLNTQKDIYLVATALTLFFCGVYDLRILYIGLFLLIFWTIIHIKVLLKQKILFLKIGVAAVLFVSLYTFWVLPTLHMGLGANIDRPIFGDTFWTLGNAFLAYHPFWTSFTQIHWFVSQNIPVFQIIIPITIILCFLYIEKVKYRAFFLFLFLLGVFLSKATNAPFGGVYSWLYQHLPGFNAFREPTKFYIITIISYSFFAGLLLQKGKYTKLFEAFIIFLFIVSNVGMMLGIQKNTYIENIQPKEQNTIATLLAKERRYSRVLWLPANPLYSYMSYEHPAVRGVGKAPFPKYDGPLYAKDNEVFKNIITNPLFPTALNDFSVKYIIVEPQDGDETYNGFASLTQENLQNALGSVKGLKNITPKGISGSIFQNTDYSPHIFSGSGQIIFSQINQTKYDVYITGVQKNTILYFLEAYNTGWKLYQEPVSSVEICSQQNSFTKQNSTECIQKKKAFILSDTKYLGRTSFSAKNTIYGGYANSWNLKIQDMEKMGQEYFITHPDGSIDVHFTLYFEPELYFYKGIIISCLVFLVFVLWGGISYFILGKKK